MQHTFAINGILADLAIWVRKQYVIKKISKRYFISEPNNFREASERSHEDLNIIECVVFLKTERYYENDV